jgi:glycosyltransferase involved in cell wall biosynthesis
MSAWLAYVGPFEFPWGQPGSRRVYGIARSLAAYGWDVVVASGSASPSALTPMSGVEGAGSISYVGLGELPAAGASMATKATRVLLRWGRRTVDWIEAQPSKPACVLLYGGSAQYAARLSYWCRRNRVPLVADVVERYDPHHMPGGRLGPLYLSAETAFRVYYPRLSGVIAVSSFLENHFRERGARVLRVPPTLDVRGLHLETGGRRFDDDATRTVFTYAGVPGGKDLLADIIRAVEWVNSAGGECTLHVLGPSEAQLRRLLGGQAVPMNVRSFGAVAQHRVGRLLQQADFSVLLRTPKRFAHAGFPTKFGESMANATPVIANVTSDIADYLRDGIEGLVCPDHRTEALVPVLWRAIELGAGQRRAMRLAARERALTSFDYRRYVQPLGTFIEGTCS